jgi:hypothetical protein
MKVGLAPANRCKAIDFPHNRKKSMIPSHLSHRVREASGAKRVAGAMIWKGRHCLAILVLWTTPALSRER